MKRRLRLLVAVATMALFSGTLPAFQSTSAAAAAKTAATAAVGTPSDKDIADAKAKGLVWVNTDSKIYHKDGKFYGKTKQGKFMTEADAQKAGYREAKSLVKSKKSTTKN